MRDSDRKITSSVIGTKNGLNNTCPLTILHSLGDSDVLDQSFSSPPVLQNPELVGFKIVCLIFSRIPSLEKYIKNRILENSLM